MLTIKVVKVQRTEASTVGTGLGSHVRLDNVKQSIQPLANVLVSALPYSFQILQDEEITIKAEKGVAHIKQSECYASGSLVGSGLNVGESVNSPPP